MDRNCSAGKRRNKKRKARAKQGEETVRTEDKEAESKQEVESGAEERASEAPAKEDEGRDHCLLFMLDACSFVFFLRLVLLPR